MSSFLLFLLFLIITCLSTVHACNARYLGLHQKKKANQIASTKLDDEHEEVHALIKTTEIKPLIPHDLEYGAQEGARDFKELLQGENGAKTKATSGAAIEILASSQNDLQQETKAMIQGVKRQGRSILGSSSYDAKEAEESQENDIGEDIVVTDYTSPHRKPPIHNEKP